MQAPRDLTDKQLRAALARRGFHPVEVQAWCTTQLSGPKRTRRRVLALAIRERAKFATEGALYDRLGVTP